MAKLPDYFEEYMEGKFKGLHETLENYQKSHVEDVRRIDADIKGLQKSTDWLNTKVWMAMGGLTVICFVAAYFVTAFKELNRVQIHDVIYPIQQDINSLKNNVSIINNDLHNGIEVEIK